MCKDDFKDCKLSIGHLMPPMFKKYISTMLMINCLKTKRNKSWMYFMTLKKIYDFSWTRKNENLAQNVVVIVSTSNDIIAGNGNELKFIKKCF